MTDTSQFVPFWSRLTGMRLLREGGRAGDDHVDDQPLELGVRLGGVDLVEALVELLHGQPALAGGRAEDLRVALAVGV